MNTPKGFRLHIGIYGRRNVGKSSLINAITKQNVSIVSPVAGTTTDPVEKPMELLPLGPVLFIDTAGIDDTGEVGEKRVKKTIECIKRTDLAIIVTSSNIWGEFEISLLKEIKSHKIPVIVVFNKCDEEKPDDNLISYLSSQKIPVIKTSTITGVGISDLREAIITNAPEDFFSSYKLISDIVPPRETVVLVIPIDKEAPKGRLILPQVQTLRELLD
ncbi:MAG: 50S ribosome-binding GTPase, partial [Chitinispirillaceae bacterium]|nr:50S ribosome-binding GTPase [Chitinispirillaceae bacterium]